MEDPAPGSHRLAPNDRSLEIHVCHSLAREFEVLRDQLLSMFAAEQAPKTSDVLVLTPDLETAAPLIESIFGSAEDKIAIPYVISGRPMHAINDYAQSLVAILRFARSRFGADQLFSLLQRPLIARRFGMTDEDLIRIQGWLDEAGIRWAIDGKHRQRFGLPNTDAYSLSNGLERLYLGYAMPSHYRKPVQGLLPAGDPEGSEAHTLGRFQIFVDALARLSDQLVEAKDAEAWLHLCLQTIEQFTDVEFTNQDDYRAAITCIHKLHQDLCNAAVQSAVDTDVFLAALESCFDEPLQGAVPAGCLCFASMHSMRGLPYRIICIVGLGDEAFPRRDGPLEFDLMTERPRAGDRHKRLDDRALFLDLLLSARERFYISYTGRSMLDNSCLPPSMLLAELMDAASLLCAELKGADAAPGPSKTASALSSEAIDKAKRRLIIEHPLQPFSVDYFRQGADPRMRSYRRTYRNAQEQRLKAASANILTRRFFSAALPAPAEPSQNISLERLIEFFSNPSRYLLKHRLGLVLKRTPDALENHEPFEVGYRSAQKLADRLIDFALAGETVDSLRSYAKAGLEFPPGRLGDIARERELDSIIRFAAQLKPRLGEPRLEAFHHTIRLELDKEHCELNHSLSDLRLHGLCRYRYADATCYDYLRAWIQHLALQSLALPSATSRHSYWHFRDRVIELRPVEEAQSLLRSLLQRYRDGLSFPLRFFPKSAWAFMTNGQSIRAAQQIWLSSPHHAYGEADDPAYQIALRGIEDPLDEKFEQQAQAVFGPLLEVLGEIKP
jgi:exodeoxyribonuclease V gamma subunit